MADRHVTSRRQWLAACAGGTAGIAGLAGCVDGGDGNGDDDGGGLLGGGDDDSGEDAYDGLPGWPMYAADHRSSGSNPDATVPTGDVEELWSVEHSASIGQSAAPVIVDGVLYVGWEDASFRAIDVETGEVLWERQFEGWQPTMGESALVVEDTVYLHWNRHRVALDVSDGSTRWSVEEDADPFQLNYYDGSIYGTKGNARQDHAQIVRWDPADGTEEVVVEFDPADVSHTLAIADDAAYVSLADQVVAVDLESDEELWRWTHPEGDPTAHAGVTVADGQVYATTSLYAEQNELPGCFALDAESGDEEWRFTPDVSELRSPPAVSDGVVYVADDGLWAVDAESGDELWSNQSVTAFSKPAVTDGTVVVWGQSVSAVPDDGGEVAWTWDASRSGLGYDPMAVVQGGVVFLAHDRGVLALGAA